MSAAANGFTLAGIGASVVGIFSKLSAANPGNLPGGTLIAAGAIFGAIGFALYCLE